MLALLVALVCAQPALEPAQTLPLAEPPVVVWADDDVVMHAGLTLDTLPVQPLVGEVLAVNQTLVATRGRIVLLLGADRLATLAGQGTWRIVPGGLETAFGSPPILETVSYREGGLPLLQPVASGPSPSGLGATLALLEPRAPVARTPPTELRWRWLHQGGRFDLTVVRIDQHGDAGDPIVERWRNIEGRAHKLWTTLVPGASYRVTIALASESGVSAISDTRALRVLAPHESAAIDGMLHALDALAAAAKDYRPELDVLKARLFESHGLWFDAEALWTGLAILYPVRSELLHRALRLHRRSLSDE